MRAGKLRHKVTLQSKSETRDDTGQVFRDWSDTATIYASVEPLSGRELVNAQAIESETTYRITIRHLAGVTTEQRIKFGSRYFEILSVINPEERNIMLQLMCKETQ